MDVPKIVAQLYPSLSAEQCEAWVMAISTRPDYYIVDMPDAGCIVKVYNQSDPPWLRVAHETAWWGHGRHAVRALHRGMDWARLQGATHFGYSLVPHLDVVKWRRL